MTLHTFYATPEFKKAAELVESILKQQQETSTPVAVADGVPVREVLSAPVHASQAQHEYPTYWEWAKSVPSQIKDFPYSEYVPESLRKAPKQSHAYTLPEAVAWLLYTAPQQIDFAQGKLHPEDLVEVKVKEETMQFMQLIFHDLELMSLTRGSNGAAQVGLEEAKQALDSDSVREQVKRLATTIYSPESVGLARREDPRFERSAIAKLKGQFPQLLSAYADFDTLLAKVNPALDSLIQAIQATQTIQLAELLLKVRSGAFKLETTANFNEFIKLVDAYTRVADAGVSAAAEQLGLALIELMPDQRALRTLRERHAEFAIAQALNDRTKFVAELRPQVATHLGSAADYEMLRGKALSQVAALSTNTSTPLNTNLLSPFDDATQVQQALDELQHMDDSDEKSALKKTLTAMLPKQRAGLVLSQDTFLQACEQQEALRSLHKRLGLANDPDVNQVLLGLLEQTTGHDGTWIGKANAFLQDAGLQRQFVKKLAFMRLKLPEASPLRTLVSSYLYEGAFDDLRKQATHALESLQTTFTDAAQAIPDELTAALAKATRKFESYTDINLDGANEVERYKFALAQMDDGKMQATAALLQPVQQLASKAKRAQKVLSALMTLQNATASFSPPRTYWYFGEAARITDVSHKSFAKIKERLAVVKAESSGKFTLPGFTDTDEALLAELQRPVNDTVLRLQDLLATLVDTAITDQQLVDVIQALAAEQDAATLSQSVCTALGDMESGAQPTEQAIEDVLPQLLELQGQLRTLEVTDADSLASFRETHRGCSVADEIGQCIANIKQAQLSDKQANALVNLSTCVKACMPVEVVAAMQHQLAERDSSHTKLTQEYFDDAIKWFNQREEYAPTTSTAAVDSSIHEKLKALGIDDEDATAVVNEILGSDILTGNLEEKFTEFQSSADHQAKFRLELAKRKLKLSGTSALAVTFLQDLLLEGKFAELQRRVETAWSRFQLNRLPIPAAIQEFEKATDSELVGDGSEGKYGAAIAAMDDAKLAGVAALVKPVKALVARQAARQATIDALVALKQEVARFRVPTGSLFGSGNVELIDTGHQCFAKVRAKLRVLTQQRGGNFEDLPEHFRNEDMLLEKLQETNGVASITQEIQNEVARLEGERLRRKQTNVLTELDASLQLCMPTARVANAQAVLEGSDTAVCALDAKARDAARALYAQRDCVPLPEEFVGQHYTKDMLAMINAYNTAASVFASKFSHFETWGFRLAMWGELEHSIHQALSAEPFNAKQAAREIVALSFAAFAVYANYELGPAIEERTQAMMYALLSKHRDAITAKDILVLMLSTGMAGYASFFNTAPVPVAVMREEHISFTLSLFRDLHWARALYAAWVTGCHFDALTKLYQQAMSRIASGQQTFAERLKDTAIDPSVIEKLDSQATADSRWYFGWISVGVLVRGVFNAMRTQAGAAGGVTQTKLDSKVLGLSLLASVSLLFFSRSKGDALAQGNAALKHLAEFMPARTVTNDRVIQDFIRNGECFTLGSLILPALIKVPFESLFDIVSSDPETIANLGNVVRWGPAALGILYSSYLYMRVGLIGETAKIAVDKAIRAAQFLSQNGNGLDDLPDDLLITQQELDAIISAAQQLASAEDVKASATVVAEQVDPRAATAAWLKAAPSVVTEGQRAQASQALFGLHQERNDAELQPSFMQRAVARFSK